MTQPIQLTDQVFAVEVPEGVENFRIIKFSQPETLSYDYSITRGERVTTGLIAMIDLPFGNWQLICTTKEVTEEQAKGIVKELPVGARWMNYNGDYPVWWHSAKESLRSLLASKNLDPNKNYILIKKLP